MLDADPRHGGDESLALLENEHGRLPATAVSLTGGDDRGRHRLFAHPGVTIRNRAGGKGGWPAGLDVRADGGYIVAPPSLHISGRRYAWEAGSGPHEVPVALMPVWLLEMLAAAPLDEAPRPSRATASSAVNSADHDLLIQAATRYVAAVPGQERGGRDNAAFSLAGHLHAFVVADSDLRLTDQEVLGLLRTWDLKNSEPLGEAELTKKVHSVFVGNGKARNDHVVERRTKSHSATRIRDAEPGGLQGTVRAIQDRPKDPIPRFTGFPVDTLPDPIGSFVSAGAQAIGCDASFIALPLLAALATAIGNTRRIQLKKSWLAPPLVWTAIVGESGTSKTPAFALAMRPLKERQKRAMEAYQEAVRSYAQDHAYFERAYSQWKKSKSETDPPEEPPEPRAERYIVSDITVEALAPLLLANPRGLLMCRDELAGWLGSFDRYAGGNGRVGADAANWLSMYNAEGFVVDRKTGKPPTIFVPQAAVCITGGIQPAILHKALGSVHRESGLAARLLLACPPRRPKRWTEADVAASATRAVGRIFDRLYALQWAVDEEGQQQSVAVALTPEARAEWVAYYSAHNLEQLELTGEMSAAWSKLEEYAARLALVIHCTRWAAGEASPSADSVDAESMAAAVRLAEWFKLDARRVYAMLGETPEEGDRRRLVEWLERYGSAATAREAQQGCRWLATAQEAEAALEELVKSGQAYWEASPSGQRGQPTRRCVLLTAVYGNSAKPGENTNTVDVDSVDASENDFDMGDWGEV